MDWDALAEYANADYWDPIEVTEPALPEGAASIALMENEQTGVLDLVLLDGEHGPVLATLSEGPGGWHVTRGGVYLTQGPKATLEAALSAALRDEYTSRRLANELVSDVEDLDTQPMVVRHG